MDSNIQNGIKELVGSAQNVLILTHKDPTIDDVAASLALSQALSQAGKITSVGCPTPLTVEFTSLFGVDKVETKVSNKNLVISLDYAEGSIEKVSYNVEGDKFNLIIQPKNGFPPFSPEKVHYDQTGINADVIIVVGTEDLTGLDSIYNEDKEIFEKIPVINLDYHMGNRNYGKINFISQNASSCSQIVMELIKALNYSLDSDAASNILTGLESATNGFTSGNITAETFEVAALSLRYGAQRLFKGTVSQASSMPQNPFPQPPQVASINGEPQGKQEFPPSEKKGTKPPPDWLQPKVYKGGQLL